MTAAEALEACEAGQAAINAAHARHPGVTLDRLLVGIFSIIATDYTPEQQDAIAASVAYDVLQLVGKRRALVLVEEAAALGGGKRFG